MNTFLRITVLIAVLAGSIPANAGTSVESVSPGVGQRGTEFTIKLVGANLSASPEVLFYQPGLKCVGVKAVSETELNVVLKSDTNCPLGTFPFRLQTALGISELKVIRVTPFPVVAATEPNETPTQAVPTSLNTTITGVLPSGDVDCFFVTLKKGDRLAAEVEAVRLGGQLVDTILHVYGPDGKLLAKADDTSLFGQDPFLSLSAPADGKYVIQVQEAALEGDDNSRYALHIGNFPRPSFVYPAGGPAGQTVPVRFQGDALGEIAHQVVLPASASASFGLFAEQSGITSPTPIPFRVSPFGNVLESEANDELATVMHTPAELPIAFNGVLEKTADVDRFRFRATEGQAFQFEAFAERLGSRADTVISIVDTSDTLLVRNDDDGSHDSRLIFRASRTGEYHLVVSDKRGEGGANFVYRVEATVPQPELTAFLPRANRENQERQTINVPRGNRVMAFLGVQRKGVEGPIRLDPRGLPAGMSSPATTVPGDQFLMPVVFEATEDAPLGGTLAQVTASGDIAGKPITGEFRQVVDLIHGSADTLYQKATLDRLAVAVVEPAAFRIQLEEPKTTLARDGTIGLVVHVERTADFKDPVDITFPFLPPGVDGPPKFTIPADQTSGVYVAHAFPRVEPRSWSICAEGRPALSTTRDPNRNAAVGAAGAAAAGGAQGPRRGGRRRRTNTDAVVSSQLVTLTISESPATGSIGRVATEQGAVLKLSCTIERTAPLPESLVATLEGLPNRVLAKSVTVGANDGRVEFTINLDQTAPVGTFNSLVCRLTGVVGGQEVSYCIGRGGVLKIEPAGGLVKDETGRPLSPLEVLRKAKKSL